VQKVVAAVNADKAKLDAYCRLANIQQQMGTLDEKKDASKLQALGQQADAEAQKIGPDFGKVMDGLEQVDENSAEGKKFAAILGTLDSKCSPQPQQAQPLPPPGQQRMAPPQQQQAQPVPPPGGPQRMAPPAGPQQQAAKPTEAQVQKIVSDVGANKAKLDSYCKISKLQQQMGALDEKKDAKKLQALGQQADAEAQKLGPDFEKVMDGLEQVDPNSAEGKKLGAILASLDTKCPK
jgi:DNA uptake protein ComE-like DNA-binding protein